MNLINAEHLTHSFTERKVLDDASFILNEGEKVGIIGVNGTGKSTLLRMLAGIIEPDEGSISRKRGLKIGYLPQSPEFNEGHTVLEAALSECPPEDRASKEPEAKKMLNVFAIRNFSQNINELSGGQRKRVALVRTFLSDSDMMILDEPTNHIDSYMAEWLEKELNAYRGAIIMITHDRYFLDSVVSRIVELDHGKCYSYDDNYLGYLAIKEQREAIAAATERKRRSILRNEIRWMMRGARARTTKQKAHIERYENLKNVEPPKHDIEEGFKELSAQMEKVLSARLGNTTVEVDNISKSYGSNVLISGFSYIFLKHDRIGIIGANGCGKTTLLKIMTGLSDPDSGSVKRGQTVRIAYFSQENEQLDPGMKVIEYVKSGAEIVRTSEGTITASQMLERFLFPSNMHYMQIGRLSGGEKRRLYLLRLLMMPSNFLILDEPTNDLDIETLTILEDFLDHYDGIVVTVSHDRYFLDRIAGRIFAFTEGGIIKQYEGGYSDFLEKSGGLASSVNEGKTVVKKSDSETIKKSSNLPKKLKMSFNEQREFDTIEAVISGLEEKLAALDAEASENTANYWKLLEIAAEKEKAEAELEEKMERWAYLTELDEKIKNR